MVNGYPINWAMPMGSKLAKQPLYIKYSGKTIGQLVIPDILGDYGQIMAIADNAEIIAYMSWLIRTAVLSTTSP